MDATILHPKWIVTGLALCLGGIWLFRWGRRNDRSGEIAAATAEAAINKLRKNTSPKEKPPAAGSTRSSAAERFRNSMAQFLGIVGALMIIAGLVSMIFGVFYEGA
jgi:hypothetical protein